MTVTQPKPRPRILILENGIAITGGIRSVMRSCIVLRNDFDFTFLLPKNSKASSYVRAEGFVVYELAMLELSRDIFSLLLYMPVLLINVIRFSAMLRKIQIDVIHSNDFYNLIPPLYRMFGGKVPYVCYVRFLPSKFPKALVKFWCFWHDHFAFSIVAVSKAVQRELGSLKTVVIGGELPLEDVPYKPGYSNVLLYPANYIQGKGQESALRSFALISGNHPEWKLRFMGSDMQLKKNAAFKMKLVKMADELGCQSQIEWREFSNDMKSEYLDASIVINFSDSESFSLTCLEALFYARPVIATDSGGPTEIIDHGVSGLIVAVGDIIAMSQALDFLMKDSSMREQMGGFGRQKVMERFSLERTTYLLRGQYLDVVHR